MDEAEIDRLYALPLDQFTAARDELARRLRKESDRDGAGQVKQLRKPSVAAWALNQVRFSEPQAVDRLIAAGEQLRDAQLRLLEQGERGKLREAVAGERGAVEEVVALAEDHLREAGHPLTAAVEGKLRDTAHATALDEEAREQLTAGRLVHEHVVSDLGLAGAAPAPRKAAKPARPREDTRKLEALRRRLDQAQAARDEAETARRDAERDAKDARRAAERAEAKLERARARADEAAARARELEDELAELGSGDR